MNLNLGRHQRSIVPTYSLWNEFPLSSPTRRPKTFVIITFKSSVARALHLTAAADACPISSRVHRYAIRFLYPLLISTMYAGSHVFSPTLPDRVALSGVPLHFIPSRLQLVNLRSIDKYTVKTATRHFRSFWQLALSSPVGQKYLHPCDTFVALSQAYRAASRSNHLVEGP